MKKICSNQVLEPTFSKHVLEIDVDSIEKFIHCSLQGGPFGGPACPPVSYIHNFQRLIRWAQNDFDFSQTREFWQSTTH